jgi:hypothetical protein
MIAFWLAGLAPARFRTISFSVSGGGLVADVVAMVMMMIA